MRGFDLGEAIVDDFFKVILPLVFVAVLSLVSTAYVGYKLGFGAGVTSVKESPKEVLTDIRKADRLYGYQQGVLAMANLDRRYEGLKPYKDWEDFNKQIAEEQEILAGARKVIEAELARREKEKEKPPKPWLEQKR